MASNRWADHPFALIAETGVLSHPDVSRQHPAVSMAEQMALSHNVILRGINASYNQCLSVKAKTTEATDFLIFNQCIFEVIKTHHDIEERYMFPAIEKYTSVVGIMDQNVQEHRAFHHGLDKFRQYVYETDANRYDGKTLQAIIDEFGKPLETHLHNEIPTLLSLKEYDPSQLRMIGRTIGKHFQKANNVYRHVPLFMGCADNSFAIDGKVTPFPPVPFFVPYIVKYIFASKYSGAWKFNPCDMFGRPKPFRFLNPNM